MLISPYGCKMESHKGLSIGSVLLILFFTIAGIYFIGGIITLRILRGATGWEMLPNHDFWTKLPSLVRVSDIIFLIKYNCYYHYYSFIKKIILLSFFLQDGIVFTFNCCRADSYERI